MARAGSDSRAPGPAPADGARLRCTIALPEAFRCGDILSFHRRDAQQIAECADEHGLRKALVWAGQPACIELRFGDAGAELDFRVDVQAGAAAPDAAAMAEARTMVRRMLGLLQPVEAFEAAYRHHPALGPVIAANHGLRVPQTATPFEALVWAVTGQQISLHAAVALRRALIRAAGVSHSSGLQCFPDAAGVLAVDEEALRAGGFSRAKAGAIRALAQAVADQALPLERWVRDPPVEEIRECLLQIRGIGPWTVNYALLRGFGWLDGSLHGDVAVRRGLQRLLGCAERVDEAHARRWLEPFSPWRALAAAHLWTVAAKPGP